MIEFATPWVFLALPLPLFIWWLWPPAPEAGAALRVPFYKRVVGLSRGDSTTGKSHKVLLMWVVQSVVWLLLVVAVARPLRLGPAQPVASQGRDMILALDLSGSMATPDFEIKGRAIDRFSVVRAVARQFTLERKGDRVGLVLFGTRAFLQAPVTPDLETVATFVAESEVGLAGQETAIGDAIGLAVKHLRDRPAQERVLVLLTDGANNAGVLEPARAAELARDAHVRIYTIGVGSKQRIVSNVFGQHVIPGTNDLDERALRDIAEKTGGSYFRADDTESLLRVYAEIDRLEPADGQSAMVRPSRSLFFWPLGGALALTGLLGFARMGGSLLPFSPRRMSA